MKKSQGKPADIWGVGCVVIEMLTNSPPWGSLNLSLDLVSKQIMSGAMPPLPSTISEECQDFLNQVFRFRPEDRPTACELLDHPFIRGIFLSGNQVNNPPPRFTSKSDLY